MKFNQLTEAQRVMLESRFKYEADEFWTAADVKQAFESWLNQQTEVPAGSEKIYTKYMEETAKEAREEIEFDTRVAAEGK